MAWYYYILIVLAAAAVLGIIYWIMKGYAEEQGAYDNKAARVTSLKRLVCYKWMKDFLLYGWKPHLPAFWTKKETIVWETFFSDASKYRFAAGDPDQRDWNKGGGLTFYCWNHQKESAMWGWRYNPELDKFEVCAYNHIGSSDKIITPSDRYKDDKETALRIDPNSRVIVALDIDYLAQTYTYTFSQIGRSTNERLVQPFSHRRIKSKEITPNFGGNRRAPSKIVINWIRR